jgi:hypothetical protein
VKRLLCVAVVLAAVSACGPIDYINTVTIKASRAVAEARTANAEKLSPYEWWSAVEYLQMAREKAAYAEYQISINYGETSEKMAKEAKKISIEKGEQGPSAKGPSAADAPTQVVPSTNTPSEKEINQ